MSIPRHFANKLATNFTKLMGGEASAGILLIIVAALAMIIVNVGWSHEYHELFHGELAWTPVAKLDTLHLWINDALMAIFFFAVGLDFASFLAHSCSCALGL